MLKFLHESGHAIRCRMEGGRVGDAGVNFLFVAPDARFVDVTQQLAFLHRCGNEISVCSSRNVF